MLHLVSLIYSLPPICLQQIITLSFAICLAGKGGKDSLDGAMIRQTMEAARKSDLVLLMFDARVGVTSDLAETIRWLRKISHNPASNKKKNNKQRDIVILANKLEGDRWSSNDDNVLDNLEEISRCGFGEAIPISAEHGEGMAG